MHSRHHSLADELEPSRLCDETMKSVPFTCWPTSSKEVDARLPRCRYKLQLNRIQRLHQIQQPALRSVKSPTSTLVSSHSRSHRLQRRAYGAIGARACSPSLSECEKRLHRALCIAYSALKRRRDVYLQLHAHKGCHFGLNSTDGYTRRHGASRRQLPQTPGQSSCVAQLCGAGRCIT